MSKRNASTPRPAENGLVAKIRGLGVIKGSGVVAVIAAAVVALVWGVMFISSRPSGEKKIDQKVGGNGVNVTGGNVDNSHHSSTTQSTINNIQNNTAPVLQNSNGNTINFLSPPPPPQVQDFSFSDKTVTATYSDGTKHIRSFDVGIRGLRKVVLHDEVRCVLWTEPDLASIATERVSKVRLLDAVLNDVWKAPFSFDPKTPYPENESGSFEIAQVQSFHVDDGKDYLFAIYHDQPFFASAVVVIDEAGDEIKRMWNPGHLLDIVQFRELFCPARLQQLIWKSLSVWRCNWTSCRIDRGDILKY